MRIARSGERSAGSGRRPEKVAYGVSSFQRSRAIVEAAHEMEGVDFTGEILAGGDRYKAPTRRIDVDRAQVDRGLGEDDRGHRDHALSLAL